MQGESQAIMRCAPAPFGSGLVNAAQRTPGNNTVALVPGAGDKKPGCWVTITAVGGDIAWSTWATASGAHPALVFASDAIIPQGATVDYWLNSGIDSLKFLNNGTGEASWFRSSL